MELSATPWVDRTWRNVWERVAALVDESWLPDVYEGRKALSVHEYGSGNYGVVSPTNEPGLVVKVTTDVAEAQFVSWALSISPPSAGIVKYHRILAVTGATYKRRPVYILWRDEAFEVGTSNEHFNANKLQDREARLAFWEGLEQHEIMGKILSVGRYVRDQFVARRKSLSDASYNRFLSTVWREFQAREAAVDANEFVENTPAMIANYIQYTWEQANALSTRTYFGGIGHAMAHYLNLGVLLADVHFENIGRSMPGGPWVITDPGHCVVVNPKVSIPAIQAV